MKPNTYVKIVSAGIANPVEELMPFIQAEEIMPLQEDESVEVRSSVFNEGNIIIFRNRRSREVLSVIHTPHTVYIQEQNKTISTHRPTSSFLYAMGENGKLESVGLTGPKIKLPNEFYAHASGELNDVMAHVTAVLEQLTPGIIEATIEFDRFNLRCRSNVALEEAFGYVQEALALTVGYQLTPVKGSERSPYEIDYFYLDPVERTLYVSKKDESQHDWPVDPDINMPVDPESERGKDLLRQSAKSILPKTFGSKLNEPAVIDFRHVGQQGPE